MLLILVTVLVAIVVVTAILAFVVPAQYTEHQSFTLNSELGWRQFVCIPDQSVFGWVTTNASFTWSTSGPAQVTFLVWPSLLPGLNPFPSFPPLKNQTVYDVTGSSGSGWYLSGPYPGNDRVEDFAAIGVSNPSASVAVTITYVFPGHYLGGPSVAPTCD